MRFVARSWLVVSLAFSCHFLCVGCSDLKRDDHKHDARDGSTDNGPADGGLDAESSADAQTGDGGSSDGGPNGGCAPGVFDLTRFDQACFQ